ncbi:MAG: PAS domain S-box protein, partial [Bacteroidia bacterium]|nr:PAS domain S-box protein [Bacteroidia bacterium]
GKEIKIGEDFRNYVLEKNNALFETSFQKALKGEATSIEIERGQGTLSGWFCFKINPVFGSPASVIEGVTITATDINKRKQAEIALKVLAKNFEAIIENTNESIVLLGKEYNVLLFNKTASSQMLLNMKKKLFQGADFRDFLFQNHQQKFAENYQNALNGITYKEEFSFTNVDGEIHWIDSKMFPAYGADGEILGVSIFSNNIDERKQAQLAVAQSEQKFRKIIESATNPIIIINEALEIKMVNPEAFNVFGYKPEELLDQHIEIIIPEKHENFYNNEKGYSKHNRSKKLDINRYTTARKKDGTEIVIEVSNNSFDLENEKFILVIIQDVTQRVYSEKRLKDLNYMLSFLNKINDIILASKDEQVLLVELCKAMVEEGGYKLSWVCMREAGDGNFSELKYKAAYGEIAYLENIDIKLFDDEHSKGPTATAIRFGRTVVTNDVLTSIEFKPWRDAARKHKISSSIVLPLKLEGKTKGCLNIYSENIGEFDDIRVSILERVAKNISLAVNNIRINKEKEAVRNSLNERIKELRTIYLVTSFLQDEQQEDEILLQNIVNIIPNGWQYPEVCSAKINYNNKEYTSLQYNPSKTNQTANFKTLDGKTGSIEVVYTSNHFETTDVFLKEERDLIETLAEMLMIYFNKKVILFELKKSEMNLAAVFENTDVGHLLLDSDFNVLSFNKTFYNGYVLASGINIKKGVKFSALLLEEKKEFILNNYKTVKETKKTVFYDTKYERNGEVYYFKITISPVLEKNNFFGYSVSAVDITERKQQEIERQNMILDLTQRNRDLEQFAYIVSHNLRSPLATMLGFLSILEVAKNKKDRDESLLGLKKSAKNLDNVLMDLNDILQMRRAIAEQKIYVDFESLVGQIKESILPLIKEKKVQINHNFDEVKSITSIKSYIYNIFYNLIINSIKYSNQNVYPRIDIWSEKKGENVVLHFSDNGIGIDLEKYGDQLFGLYKRFNFTTEGKGIGLFMVKTQVEALGGSISVQSSFGKGAHFIITLGIN